MPQELQDIVLASASPRRRELLSQVGINFQVVPSNADESLLTDEDPQAHVIRMSCDKAMEVHDRQTGRTISAAVTTKVFFKDLTSLEIEGYIASKEPFDKAGSYAIQGIGSFMVPKIEGSYTNVVGLPLCEVIAALEELGAIELFAVSD